MAVSGTSSSMASMLGVKNKGIGGLVSGLDTDSLVEALTSGTRAKIAKQGQDRQLLNWKISAYRNMSSSLKAFQTKTLSYSSSSNTNISSNAFFNTYKATSSSSNVSVTASSNAQTGTFTIDSVQQLATSESLASKMTLSPELTIGLKNGDELKAGAFTGQTLSIDVGSTGKAKTINLDSLNDTIVDGKLRMNDWTEQVQIFNEDGTPALDDDNQPTYKTVTHKGFQSKLQDLLTDTFGTFKDTDGVTKSIVQATLKEDGTLKLDSDSSKIEIAETNVLLGVKESQSNRLSLGTKLGDVAALKGLEGNVFKFQINGAEISVTRDDTLQNLITKIKSSTANVNISYSEHTDEITLTAKSTGAGKNIDISDVQGNLMNELFGAKSGGTVGSNYLLSNANPISDKVNVITQLEEQYKDDKEGLTKAMKELGKNLKNMEFNVTINGVTKLVKLDTSAMDSTEINDGTFSFNDIIAGMNKGITNAFSGTEVKLVMSGDKTSFYTPDESTSITIAPSTKSTNFDGAALFGFTSKVSNVNLSFGNDTSIESSTMINAEALQSLVADSSTGTFSMTINGVTKQLGIDIAKLSVSKDPATLLNNAITEAFGKNTGVSFKSVAIPDETKPIYEKDKDGNIVYELDEDGHQVLDDDENPIPVHVRDKNGDPTYEALGYELTLNIADPNTSVTLGSGVTVGDRADIFGALGFGNVGDTSINNSNESFNGTKFSDLYAATGLKDYHGNVIREGLNDGKLLINGVEVEYSKDMEIQEFIDQVNSALGGKAYAGVSDGRLTITALDGHIEIEELAVQKQVFYTDDDGNYVKENGDPLGEGDSPVPVLDGGNPTYTSEKGNMLSKLFGIADGHFKTEPQKYGEYANSESKHKEGKNAEFIVDGKVISRTSNTVDYNGATITLNKVSSPDDAPITIDVRSDPEEVITRLKAWMDDYNALIYTLNSAINESKNSDYFPLTDEQKADMTQDQIKTWETEAKKGLLRNDQTLKGILSDMRNKMFEKVEAAGISLFDIGITTKGYTGDPNESGQLQFDTNVSGGGEAKLRSMLENDPDRVRLLFTDTTNGIATRMNTVIEAATRTSSTNRGSLVNIAGTESLTGNNTSVLGNKISALDKYVSALKIRMEDEYNRQWKKFSALEVAVQRMSAQSSWLNQ